MGLSDLLKKASDVSRAISDLQDAVNDAKGSAGVSTGKAKSVNVPSLPTTLAELQAMPGAKLTDEYAVTALAVAVLCNYERDADETYRMVDFLRGPQPMTGVDKQFIRDRLKDRGYIVRSYFKGATPENNYTPAKPYAVEISENSYSRQEQGYVKLFVHTSGADSPRPITLRLKPSTGQWFVWQLSLLTDVKKPKESDPWA